jgi:serine protease
MRLHLTRRPARGLVTFTALAVSLLVTPSASPTPSAPYAPDRVLVGFAPGTTPSEQQAVESAVGAREVAVIGAGAHVLHVPRGSVTSKIAQLHSHGKVRYAEPDYAVSADLTPNDSSYQKLWGMRKILADRAWDFTTGTRAVVVGVVDTGVDYNHPDLAANVWSNPGSINGCAAGSHGYNAITDACDPLDDNNHGTHVSGTIGAVGNNKLGVIGVDPSVSIMGLKFLNSGGSGWVSDAVEAIDWAVKAKQAGVNLRVLSNSWGGGGYSQALKDEIAKAGAYDILFVAAAGNYGSNNDTTPFYPCSYGVANEICVAATDSKDNRASFSDYGPSSVDLAAPGVGILSTVIGGQYAEMSGTSMATPHVSGAAALALSTGYQSVSTLKATLLAAVDPLASLNGYVRMGGRLDVCKAIFACGGVAPPPPPPPPPTAGDFSLSTADARQAVSPGGSTSFAVTATPSSGFTGSVTLSVSGLPPDATACFNPDPLTLWSAAAEPSALNVSAGATTPRGNYTLTVTGVSGSLTHTATVVLQVKNN